MKFNNGLLFLSGIVLALAFDDLSWKKNAIHYKGVPWLDDTFETDNAVDRNMTTCTRTEEIGVFSPYTNTWWKVDLGGVYNIYSVNILFKNYDNAEIRQRGRFAGFSLYVSTTGAMDNSSLCYKDGPELPPLNFTMTCITSGRYVTFFNERHTGVQYPPGYESSVFSELCEVIVHGCKTFGVYGSNCDVPCPSNCRNNSCNIQNGTCLGCKPGWMGPSCNTECAAGWYGQDCKEDCSGHCNDATSCNHVTGLCGGGCSAEWEGAFRDAEGGDPRCTLSNVILVAIGGTLSACVILIIVGAVFLIRRRKGLCISSTKSSPYADLELQPHGESTYQELNVSRLDTDNTYLTLID